tara:strand:- start:42 stop:521 length:480 start_codon:yes stop_codon:yes gene_type:complete
MNKLLVLFVIFALTSCSPVEIPEENLELRCLRGKIPIATLSKLLDENRNAIKAVQQIEAEKAECPEGYVYYEIGATAPFTGVALEYHENGIIWLRNSYKKGRREGISESYYENGQLNVRSSHKDGNRDGLYEKYYRNGRFGSKSCHQNGSEVSIFYCDK